MERPPAQVSTPFLPGEPCPCGASKPYNQCHNLAAGLPKSNFSFDLLRDKPTGKQKNGCYMSSLYDCEGKITREHYISKSILSQFDKIRGKGLPGNLDNLDSVPIDALTAAVLCDRHNSLLSKIDAPAGLAFERIFQLQQHMLNPNANRKKERHFLIDGYAIELWATKALLAAHVGGVSKSAGRPTRDSQKLDVDAVVQTMASGKLNKPFGLYFHNDLRPTKVHVGFSPLTDGVNLVGIRVQLVQLGFDCIFAPTKLSLAANYRPSMAVYWNRKSFTGVLHIAWDGIKVGDYIYTEELD